MEKDTEEKKNHYDSPSSLAENDLVYKARTLLDSVINSTNILEIEEMTPEDIQKAKVVLGFLNATNSLIKTKMNVFKMTNISEKVRAIEEQTRRKNGEDL